MTSKIFLVLPTEKKDPETGKPLPPFLPLYPPVEPFHFASINSKVEQHQRQNAVNKLTANYHEFEERIGYKFNNIAYLLQALTHASYQYNQVIKKPSESGIHTPWSMDRSVFGFLIKMFNEF